MEDGMDPVNFEEAIAATLRQLRQERGWSQEQVASQAREFGLDWTRVAVHNIETRKRHVSLGEFVVLPLIYEESLADLVSRSDGPYVMGGDLVLEARDVRALLRGGAGVKPRLSRRAEVSPLGQPGDRLVRAVAMGSAERNAARRLRWTPEQVAELAILLWGHGLTEERERLLSQRDVAEEAARTVRGHLTRQLLAELQQAMEREEG
jgi:transcriptional regulator with XRE-family HTH domain